jgi:hypothetical protein
MAPTLPGYRPTHAATVPVMDARGVYNEHSAYHYARTTGDGALFACLIADGADVRGVAYGSTPDAALTTARHRAGRWNGGAVAPGCPACTQTTAELLAAAEASVGRAAEAAKEFRETCEAIREEAAKNQPALDALAERIRAELARGYRLTSGTAPAQAA